MKKQLLVILFVPIFISCVKDKPVPAAATTVNVQAGSRIFVVNEGNFGSGNAGVSLMDAESTELVADYYQLQNSSALGDVAQSMNQINGQYYIVVNNSGKVVVCDPNFKKTADIKGFSSPRYILGLTPEKAYVSDLKANCIYVVNLNTNTANTKIACAGWTEQMLMVYNKVFVTNLSRNYVYVINAMNDVVTDSIEVGPSAGSIVLDRNDRVWVLSGGDENKSIPGSLTVIDPISNAVLTKVPLPGLYPFGLCTNGKRDSLYFISGSVYVRNINETSGLGKVLVQAGQANFYGLGIHPRTSDIYLSDAIDYSQRSSILVYSPKGEAKKNLKGGVNANGFYFE